MYIWQHKDWPKFHWNNAVVEKRISDVRFTQGRLAGKVLALGFDVELSTALDVMTAEVVKSSEIEGVILNAEQVRSSVAWQLGVQNGALPKASHYIEGLVDVMTDAIRGYCEEITPERLFKWHKALFPFGGHITAGQWRIGNEPMQVVSGAIGKERVHYEAPASTDVPRMMEELLEWVNSEQDCDPIVKASVAALWFVTIHPFADGNGRISRTLTDLLLTRSDGMKRRFYSMSAAINMQRKAYYNALETVQKGDLDITNWILWFADCLQTAINDSEHKIEQVVKKNEFWHEHNNFLFNERQRKVIARLLDGFVGKLTSSKWAKLASCSTDTAQRDLQALVDAGLMQRLGEGRGTHYVLFHSVTD